MPEHFSARALLGALGTRVPSVGGALMVAGAIALITVGAHTVLLKRSDAA